MDINIVQPFWLNKRVLITGHTGFKGSWLRLWLQKLGAEVWGYALEPQGQPNLFDQLAEKQTSDNDWQHCLADIANLNTLKTWVLQVQPEVVLHLAAQPLVQRSYADPLGTWDTNVKGSLNLLESLKQLKHPCAVVMITTDKVYENHEWTYGYRENDRLGGFDPYSASKAAAEIAIASWRSSFCGTAPHQTPYLRIATARAGNVIGGGDWSSDRIVPDAMRALAVGEAIAVRNPSATRPWQHVLEPLAGYMRLAEALLVDPDPPCEAFNFGPNLDSNRSVRELVENMLNIWPGQWIVKSDPLAPHEAGLLHLEINKAYHRLGWEPRWDYPTTVERTVKWYLNVYAGGSPMECCLEDLNEFNK